MKKIFNYVYMYVSVCMYLCECRCPQNPEESIRVSVTGVIGGCEPGVLAGNQTWILLKISQYSLTAEPSLIGFQTIIDCPLSQARFYVFLYDFIFLELIGSRNTLCSKSGCVWEDGALSSDSLFNPSVSFIALTVSLPLVVSLCCHDCHLHTYVMNHVFLSQSQNCRFIYSSSYATISPGCLWTSRCSLKWNGNSSNRVLLNPSSPIWLMVLSFMMANTDRQLGRVWKSLGTKPPGMSVRKAFRLHCESLTVSATSLWVDVQDWIKRSELSIRSISLLPHLECVGPVAHEFVFLPFGLVITDYTLWVWDNCG